MTAPDPLLPNLRDLGGLPTTDGRRLRPRLLFRSDGWQRLDAADRDRLAHDLELRTLVDLRSELERERTGEVELDGPTVHRVPILDGSYMQAAEQGLRLDDMFDAIAFRETAALAEAIELVGRADALPGLVFCTAGKDRTGILVALLLTALGVERDAVVADFTASEGAMERIMAAFLANFDEGELPRIPPGVMGAPAEVMEGLLARVDEQAGGARTLLLEAGVGATTLDRLERALLVG